MVQSINLKALTTMASVIRRPYLASPHVHVATISEVDFAAMRDRCGIRAVVFDKDNTLTAPYALSTHPRASRGLQHALDVFGPHRVAIMSNSAGTTADDPGYAHALEIERSMGVRVIRHDEKKPGGLHEVMAHFNNNNNTSNDDNDTVVDDPRQLCMVGDRLLTDVVFGNLYGMLTVHCLPLCTGDDNKQDNKIASTIRTVENLSMYGNWFGGRMVRSRTRPHSLWPGEDECPLVLSLASEKVETNEEETTA